MENLTQQQIEELIQFIDEAEEPATITNTIVAAVLAFLAVHLAGTATAQALLEEIVARQTADTNLSTAINQLQQLIQSMGSVVYLDSMGELDGDVDIHVDTGMVVYDPENDIIKKYTSPSQYEPVSCDAKLLYCNKVTGYFYRYSTRSGMVQVGGGGGISEDDIINDLTTGGRNKALSAEMGKELARMISNAGSSRVLEQRVAIIAEILQNAVFTSDQSQRFEDLAALEEAVDSITLNVSSHTFNGIGGTFTLVATTVPSGKAVKWRSDNPTVAFVDNNGEVTALTEGHAIITAEAGSNKVTASCAIHVQEFQIDSLALDQSSLTSTNERWHTTHQLSATATADGQPVQVEVIIWSSTNPAVATVDNNGLVTIQGNSNGQQCRIEATAGGITASCEVTVTGMYRNRYDIIRSLANASLEPDVTSILEGQSQDFTIRADESHVFASDADVAVTMKGANQDVSFVPGDKTASFSISNADGIVRIRAEATFVATNLMDGAAELDGYEVNNDSIIEKAGSKCKRVKLEKGKYYQIKNYFNTPTGANACHAVLMKDDGNGGYTPLLKTDIDTTVGLWAVNNSLFNSSNNQATTFYRLFGAGNFPSVNFIFGTPSAAELPNIGDIYMVIDTKTDYGEIDDNFGLYEWRPGLVLDFDDVLPNWRQNGYYGFQFGNLTGETAIFKLEKGATYKFDGYEEMEAPSAYGTGAYNVFGLLKSAGGLLDYLKSADMKSGSTWLDNNGVFEAGSRTYIGKSAVPVEGTFTAPSDNDVDGDIYLAVAVSVSSSDNVKDSLTITKQS